MLVEMLPFISEQPRHKHQETVLDMIAKILAEFETVLKTKVVEHESAVAGIDKERLIRESAIQEATVSLEEKFSELQATNSKLESCKSTLKTAKEELVAAQVDQSNAPLHAFLALLCPILTLVGRFLHVLNTFYNAFGDASAPLLGPILPPVGTRRALLPCFHNVLPRRWRRLCALSWPNFVTRLNTRRALPTCFGIVLQRRWRHLCGRSWPKSAPSWPSLGASHTF